MILQFRRCSHPRCADGLVVRISFSPKSTLEALLNRKHLNEVNAMAVTRLRLRSRRQCKVLVFRNIRGNIRPEGNSEVSTFPAKSQPHDNDARPTVLEHKLSVVDPVFLDKVV